mmetsp:Transcript_137802/g.239681  ORF Transcript_137802/g.239681 Transcript_137802/m.239681 type:complete len:87 (+) Transcript_137802:324-584(+)
MGLGAPAERYTSPTAGPREQSTDQGRYNIPKPSHRPSSTRMNASLTHPQPPQSPHIPQKPLPLYSFFTHPTVHAFLFVDGCLRLEV